MLQDRAGRMDERGWLTTDTAADATGPAALWKLRSAPPGNFPRPVLNLFDAFSVFGQNIADTIYNL
jgi:hypothetical protein